MTTTTTMGPSTRPPCNTNPGRLCDTRESNLIEHIEHISQPGDCQAICQNHGGCGGWSHYAEEGGEHWGHCLLHISCSTTTSDTCRDADDHRCPGPHPPGSGLRPPPPHENKCHCTSGLPTPDLDECDDGLEPGDCSSQFWPGWLCEDEEGSLIEHIEHLSQASDCQAACQNHPDCMFFSHYTEEHGEHWGHCYLHRVCSWWTDHECSTLRPGCDLGSRTDSLVRQLFAGGDPRLGPPGPRCHCLAGPQYPDIDDCDFPQ